MSLGDISQLFKLWNWAVISWKRTILALIAIPAILFIIYLIYFVETKDRWQQVLDLYFRIMENLGFGYNWAATYQSAIYALLLTFLTLGIIVFCIFKFANEMIEKAEKNADKRVKSAIDDTLLDARLAFINYLEHETGEKRFVEAEHAIKWNQESAQILIDKLSPNLRDAAEEYLRKMK